jgi:lauroyl/myristoyl acyltransferase
MILKYFRVFFEFRSLDEFWNFFGGFWYFLDLQQKGQLFRNLAYIFPRYTNHNCYKIWLISTKLFPDEYL